MKKIDLHIHSNLSDGDLSVEEIIKLAKLNACSTVSITDHDKILEIKNENNDINVIRGVELNSTICGMHILGYGMFESEKLKNKLNKLIIENEFVCLEVIKLLQNDGFDIDREQIYKYYKSLSLPCDVIDKKKIVRYLMHKKYTSTVIETYNTLIGRGQKYYVPINKFTPEECINYIHESGGIAVLAHPNTVCSNEKELYKIVKNLVNYGLDGIEIINGKKNDSTSFNYNKIANNFELVETVGSDFHYPNGQKIGISIDDDIVDKFNEKINDVKKLVRLKKNMIY